MWRWSEVQILFGGAQDFRFADWSHKYKTQNRLCGQRLEENACDVVLAAALLGNVDEVGAGGLKWGCGDDSGDFFLKNIAGEAIGGQQDGSARFEIDGEKVGLHVGRDSNRAGDHRLHAFQVSVARVLNSEGAVANELVDIGVVDGELDALAVLADVGAAVSDIAEDEFVAIERSNDCGCSHAFVFGNLAVFPHIEIGGVDGIEKPRAYGRAGGSRGCVVLHEGCHGTGAGHFSAGHASHAVADNIDAERLVVSEEVFVVGTDEADVAEGRNGKARPWRRGAGELVEGGGLICEVLVHGFNSSIAEMAAGQPVGLCQ